MLHVKTHLIPLHIDDYISFLFFDLQGPYKYKPTKVLYLDSRVIQLNVWYILCWAESYRSEKVRDMLYAVLFKHLHGVKGLFCYLKISNFYENLICKTI